MEATAVKISSVNMDERRRIDIKAGDTVRVWQKIEEKGKTRTQAFEGMVLARKHGSEPGATFTVRRVSGGYGIEKIFPLYSPAIDKIEIVKRAKVRRAKLYHIRDKAAREIKRQMRNMRFVDIATTSDIEEQASAETKKKETEEKAQAEEPRQDETPTDISEKK
jgi:large subunit ribosomal protein L19